jgi:hypothetical protein
VKHAILAVYYPGRSTLPRKEEYPFKKRSSIKITEVSSPKNYCEKDEQSASSLHGSAIRVACNGILVSSALVVVSGNLPPS